MKARVPWCAMIGVLCVLMLPACGGKKKTTAPDDTAAVSTEATPGESLDKDVVSEDYATPGDPLPSDADVPAAPANASGPVAIAPTTYPSENVGYPDYGASTSHRSGGGGTATGGSYTVKKGDSLWTISRRNGTTVRALAEANGISQNATLRVGQRLTVPGGASGGTKGGTTVGDPGGASAGTPVGEPTGAGGGKTYTVKRGDSYTTIARQHGTTVRKLKEANGATSDMLRVGQKLKLP